MYVCVCVYVYINIHTHTCVCVCISEPNQTCWIRFLGIGPSFSPKHCESVHMYLEIPEINAQTGSCLTVTSDTRANSKARAPGRQCLFFKAPIYLTLRYPSF